MNNTAKKNKIKITILFDNYIYNKRLKTGWGFSCIIEGFEKRILFDTGSDGEILLSNMNKLGLNPGDVDCIIISHNHWDHTGGLGLFLEKNNNILLYLPASDHNFILKKDRAFKGKILLKEKPVEICRHVFLTGEMGTNIKEQSVLLNTDIGLIIITGCAHPGITNILEKARDIINKNIYFGLGGFHLMNMSENEIKHVISEFRKFGVAQVGATHCTGDRAIELFKYAYGENIVKVGVGKILNF